MPNGFSGRVGGEKRSGGGERGKTGERESNGTAAANAEVAECITSRDGYHLRTRAHSNPLSTPPL